MEQLLCSSAVPMPMQVSPGERDREKEGVHVSWMPLQHRIEEEEEEEEGSQMLAQQGEGRGGGVVRPQLLSPRLTSLLVLVLASILTLILAFLLGQYAT